MDQNKQYMNQNNQNNQNNNNKQNKEKTGSSSIPGEEDQASRA